MTENDELLKSLVDAILRNNLDVAVPEHLREAHGSQHDSPLDLKACLDRADAVGDIARVAQRLEAAGIDVSGYRICELPSPAEVEAVTAGIGGRVPQAFLDFLKTLPSSAYFEWSSEGGELTGRLFYG